jgi:hypothetical protein
VIWESPESQTLSGLVLDRGTNYVAATRLKFRIPATQLKFRSKKDNITGLQLCDLLAHPSQQYVRYRQRHEITFGKFATRLIPILIADKYHRSEHGMISGYGTKYLP